MDIYPKKIIQTQKGLLCKNVYCRVTYRRKWKSVQIFTNHKWLIKLWYINMLEYYATIKAIIMRTWSQSGRNIWCSVFARINLSGNYEYMEQNLWNYTEWKEQASICFPDLSYINIMYADTHDEKRNLGE